MKRMIAAVVLITILGCGLTSDQITALQGFEAQLTTLEGRMMSYEVEVKAVIEKIRLKQIPVVEGMALIEKILEQKAQDKVEYSATMAKYKELKEQDIPWYYLAGTGLITVLGLFGGKKYLLAKKVLEAVVYGVEKSDSKEAKLSITKEATSAGIETELNTIVKRIT